VRLLVVEVFHQDAAVPGERGHESIPGGRSGRCLPGRQGQHHLVQRRRDPLMLGLHPPNDAGLQVYPGQQHRPDQLVLPLMVVVQSQPVPAKVRGQPSGAARVAVRDGGDEGREQPRFAAEGPVDNDHVLGVHRLADVAGRGA
jgi:hypothetical protein